MFLIISQYLNAESINYRQKPNWAAPLFLIAPLRVFQVRVFFGLSTMNQTSISTPRKGKHSNETKTKTKTETLFNKTGYSRILLGYNEISFYPIILKIKLQIFPTSQWQSFNRHR